MIMLSGGELKYQFHFAKRFMLFVLLFFFRRTISLCCFTLFSCVFLFCSLQRSLCGSSSWCRTDWVRYVGVYYTELHCTFCEYIFFLLLFILYSVELLLFKDYATISLQFHSTMEFMDGRCCCCCGCLATILHIYMCMSPTAVVIVVVVTATTLTHSDSRAVRISGNM